MAKKEKGVFGKFSFVGLFLVSRSKGLFLLLLTMSILSAVLGIFVPQVIGVMTNALQGGIIPESFPFAWFKTPIAVTMLFVISGLLKILVSFTAGVVDRAFQNNLTQHLKLYLHDKILAMDAQYHNQHNEGENLFNINSATGVVASVSMLCALPVASLLGLYLAIMSLYASMKTVSIPLWLMLCILPALFAQPFIGFWLGNLINKAFAKLRAANMALNEELLNSMKSPVEVQVMNAQKPRSSFVLMALRNVVRCSNKANSFAILDSQLTSICILFFQALIAIVITIFYSKNSGNPGTAGSLVTCIMLIPEVFNQIGAFVATYIQAKQAEPEIDVAYKLITATPAIQNTPDAVAYSAEAPSEITLDNVDFGYDPNELILKHLSVKIPAGKSVAIVSHSGGGKSTLLNLLSRLYEPQNGEISVAGRNIRQYAIGSLRESLLRISQFPLFVKGTVRENFLLQKPNATDDEIKEVCQTLGVWEVLAEQSKTGNPVDFQLSLGAENLSGGQRRRLSIARAMLGHPSILLLDEPTTGVDAETTQKVILPYLNSLKKKHPILFVDHNMNFVRNLADMVLVLEDGKVSDFGNTEEIWTKKSSLFRKLWEEYNKNPENA